VDGNPASTAMLTPGFLGAPVPVGHHHAVCRYEPGNTKTLLAFAGLGLTLLMVGIEYGKGLRRQA
jgi:hypothetical protein